MPVANFWRCSLGHLMGLVALEATLAVRFGATTLIGSQEAVWACIIFALQNSSNRSIFRMPEFRNWVPTGDTRAQ